MTVITTGNIAKLLWPGLNAVWGTKYQEHPVEYTDLVDVFSSEQNYEEDQMLTGFGLAPVKTQGASVVYDSMGQGPTQRYTHIAALAARSRTSWQSTRTCRKPLWRTWRSRS
jgi:hypothetical protein